MQGTRPRIWKIVSTALLTFALLLTCTPGFAYQRPGVTTRVSVSSRGQETKGGCNEGSRSASVDPVISGNGRFVAFDSCAHNLVDNDTNEASDVFVHDAKTERTTLVSASSAGVLALPDLVGSCLTYIPTTLSKKPSLSASGRYVAFQSCAGNLVPPPGDVNPASDIFVRDTRKATTEIVSVDSDGLPLLGPAKDAFITRNGRFVTFTHAVGTSVAVAPNHIYIHDRVTNETSSVDVSNDGVPAVGNSSCSSATSDGRYVVFTSTAENLVADDTNGVSDVFLRDLKTEETTRISTNGTGTIPVPAVAGGFLPFGAETNCDWGPAHSISENGRFVTFLSAQVGLVPNDGNRNTDVFVKDLKTGEFERVSVTSAGEEGLLSRMSAEITPDGRYVSFSGWSDLYGREGCNALLASPGCVYNGFVFDRYTGAQDPQSITWKGEISESSSQTGGLSDDGRYTTFWDTDEDNFVHGDGNEAIDVYRRDRGPTQGVGHLVTSGALRMTGAEDFASSGIISGVDRGKAVDDRLTRLGADLRAARLIYRPALSDFYASIELEEMPQIDLAVLGSRPLPVPLVYGLRFTASGKHYEVRAGLLGSDPEFRLLECLGSFPCEQIGTLRGGYGTTGERIVFSLPLSEVRLEDGGTISDVEAYTAAGYLGVEPLKALDVVGLR